MVSRIRLRRTLPSSRGWRSRSSTGRGNSAIIEKHNAAVGKADLSSFGGMASSKERNPRAAVEWRAKGSLMEQLLTEVELPCDGVNPGDGVRLGCVEAWKQQR